MPAVIVDGRSLTLGDVVRVAREAAPVELAPEAVERMARSRALVERIAGDGTEPVYGLTTGVGVRKRVPVLPAEMAAFNRRLIADHLVAQGPPLPNDAVRATMLRLLHAFAAGHPGVRPALAHRLVEALNRGEQPHVRSRGGIGVADLGPLADLARALFVDLELQAREALALINTNAASTGVAALAVADAGRLLASLRTGAALDLEAFGGNLTPLHPAVSQVRPHPGLQQETAGLRRLLDGSPLWAPGAARNLQDPLTFRGAAAILGAAADAWRHVDGILAIELVASQENPLALPDEGRIISAANYENLPLAAGLDYLRIALTPCLTAANERLVKLLQAPLSGLTDGLAPHGFEHEGGLSEFAWTAQGLTLEARLLAAPVSIETPASTQAEAIEDRATMAPLAARRLAEQVTLGAGLLAISLVVAAQAVELRHGAGAPPLGPPLSATLQAVRAYVPFLAPGTTVAPDLEPLADAIRTGAFEPDALGAG